MHRQFRSAVLWGIPGLLWMTASTAFPADLEACRKLLSRGQYEECLKQAGAEIAKNPAAETWPELKAKAELALGQYEQAQQTLLVAIPRNPFSIRLRWLAAQTAPYLGDEGRRKSLVAEIDVLARNAAWRYTQDPENLVTLAQFALLQGSDAKEVQNVILQRARKLAPQHRDPILAGGNLALEKRDFRLAADLFRPAVEQFPEDPDLSLGLAKAVADSDPQASKDYLRWALKLNPRHADALLMQAEQLIDGELYSDAGARLAEVLKTNPHHPDALALQSVIAWIQGKLPESQSLRERALAKWKTNPRVDHLIGRKLSQKYRFTDGAAAQRRALDFDSEYLPAKKQLAQDLLRLGQEAEGWKLAHEVSARDEYDVASYNLTALEDELERFQVISRDGLRIRMEKEEARLYGDRVVALLLEARTQLCRKYKVELTQETLVEIFPKPADFAVRTFGMPAAGGYLGVCFGNVITANSPASQQNHPVNWESVLWHEFAHVATLNKTHQQMPRWLSEGISVYEERQRDPSWGEQMSPAYRKLILDGELTPIGKLSSAFLSPRNLLFAYYESSLVVEYLIEKYGFDSLLAILDDLGAGVEINTAIERHSAPLKELEQEFAAAVARQARFYGWYVDWSEEDLAPLIRQKNPGPRLIAWARQHPLNYEGLKSCAEILARLDQPREAEAILERAVRLFPYETGADSGLMQLAALKQKRGDLAGERAALLQLADQDNAAAPALLRLIEIDLPAGRWKDVRRHARRLMAIKPLIPQPHAVLAQAAIALGEHEEAVLCLRSLLALSPPDAADAHYQLALQLQALGRTDEARREVLKSLEQAPRYRQALELLLTLSPKSSAAF